ncbi:MAG: TetR/AcrR family transcriptional regulator [Pseudomonadota bacterium]
MVRTIAKDHDEKRGAILETAARFFAENGYDRASMSQLAVECGISKALIYHYYDSKEALLFDILNSHLSKLLHAIEKIQIIDGKAEENLKALVSELLENYRGADNEHRLQLEAMAALTSEQQKHLSAMQRRIVEVFSSVIAELRPDLFARDKTQLFPITMSLFAMLNWFYQWHKPGVGLSRSEYAVLATDLFLGGLKGLSPET